jgi:mono/diheme cytochrome c family protein
MNIMRLSILAAAAALLVPAAAQAASAEHGKQVFMQKGCWQCHGTQGQGAVTGPRLAPDPMPFETLSAFVRSSNRNMPPYREAVLSDGDLADLYAYLQSVPKPKPVQETPLLQQWADKPK